VAKLIEFSQNLVGVEGVINETTVASVNPQCIENIIHIVWHNND